MSPVHRKTGDIIIYKLQIFADFLKDFTKKCPVKIYTIQNNMKSKSTLIVCP